MKILNKIAIFGASALLALGAFAGTASASVPTLSLSSVNSNQIQITVSNADINAPIYLYYYQNNNGSAQSVGTIGTASNGYFSTTIASTNYNIPSGANAYVVADGLQSNTVVWPYSNNNGNGSSVSLSQTSVTVNQNQTATVTAFGGNGGYYISSNSNSSAVTATVNGSVINLYGNSYGGSSTVTVCSSNYSNSGCATLYVTVNGNGYNNYNNNNYGSITFSQPNVTVNQGTIQYVNILQNGTNYSGNSYYVSNNSNSNVVSAITGGNLVSLSGLNTGSATITICSSNNGSYNYGNYGTGSACGTLYVTVNPNYYGYSNPNTLYPTYNTNYANPYIQTLPTSVYLSRVPYTGANDWAIYGFLAALVAASGFGAYRMTRKENAA